MATNSNSVDCHFYLTGACRNGEKCPFRHSESALHTEEVCADFAQTGQCSAVDCGKRHLEAPKRMTKPPNEVPCRNEEGEGICTRADCIFKHTKTRGEGTKTSTLNTRAKVFVPRRLPAKPRQQQIAPTNMEWTPEGAAMPTASRPFANMSWIPNTQPGHPQSHSFGEPKSLFTSKSSTVVSSGADATDEGTMEMDTDEAESTVMPSAQPFVQQPSTLSASPVGSAFGGGSAFEKSIAQIGNAKPKSNLSQQFKPQQRVLPLQRKEAIVNNSSAQGSIKTIYDILGIAEQSSEPSMVRHSKQNYKPALRPAKPANRSESNSPASNVCYAADFPAYVTGEVDMDSVADKVPCVVPPVADVSVTSADTDSLSVGNATPVFGTLTAAEDVSKADAPVMVAHTVTSASNVPKNTFSTAVADSEQPVCTAVEIPKLEQAKLSALSTKKQIKYSHLSTPASATKSEDEEPALPRVLSFREIMERKRRKQAAAVATTQNTSKDITNDTSAVVVETTPMDTPYESPMDTPQEGAQTPVLVGDKRRTAGDDEGIDSDASEGKRVRRTPPRPVIKDYVALFEQELEDLSAGLSGPLENTPSSDKISHAIIKGDDIDTDISQMLEQ
ncbi:hypothetical protein COEREDRAFT_86310 [Coemansia reversa NRRL 1564]|uniref:C3H1-type domain-containing protein n=1 Tax=Coemansia reversa (strain ATCC 12441 / NRRL 1564) TaxID=763665 RepID=A0A2G5BE79_COERN|nr:hypothetical protein COEREDRAFT_86310 [Coemansia reversa NRRL 1564]|eukprot:PIA17315.1 hypothetical protein COEREDRAFT_86310 [Coemansia reversa NRRL 1564]